MAPLLYAKKVIETCGTKGGSRFPNKGQDVRKANVKVREAPRRGNRVEKKD